MKNALLAEFLKLKGARIFWVTFIAFSIAPLMGGIFIYILREPGMMENGGALAAKANLFEFSADMDSMFKILTQAIAVGGVLIFGFVASWIFGREYSDGTAKDLLSLPTPRSTILNAKFIVYFLWCMALAISNLLVGILIGIFMGLNLPDWTLFSPVLWHYFLTTFLTIIIGTPIAFMSLWGKGYLVPLGWVALTLVFSQIIAAVGFGYYFPWSIPGLFSGAAGDFKEQLDSLSFIILGMTSLVGYLGTIYYWKYADQTA